MGKLNEVLLPLPGRVLDPDGLGWTLVESVDCPLDMGKLKKVPWLPEGTPVGLPAELEGTFPVPVGTLVELLIGKLKERDPESVDAGPPGPDSG